MSSLTTLARPYAKAAFEIAQGADALGSWGAALDLASIVVAEEQMAEWLESPDQTTAAAVDIIEQAVKGDLDPVIQHGDLGDIR